LHIIYTGQGKSSSNEITGIDTRGKGGYIILPPSEIDGKGEYMQADRWDRIPLKIDEDVLLRFFPPREARPPSARSVLSSSEDFLRAKKAVAALSVDRASDYSDWVKVGMSLHQLGNDGLSLFHEFSQKARDKYKPSEVDDKWDKIGASSVTLGTLYYYAGQDKPGWWKDK
jgi:hypothetical protein